MNDIKVNYNKFVELMEYVEHCYNYNNWMWIVQYKKSMCMYALSPNYIQCKENDQTKRLSMYIDGSPKEIGNIIRFINSSRLLSINKWSNCIFKAHKRNQVFVCVIKSISVGEELLIDYNLNHADTKNSLSWDW